MSRKVAQPPGRPPVTSRQAVVEAAVEVFDRDGISGLTMRAVAAQAGIGLATLYAYVPDKEALVALALAGVERDLPQHLTAGAGELQDWVDGIKLWVLATWNEATQHPGVLDLMASQRFLPRGTGAVTLLARIVQLAHRDGVPIERVAYALKTASDYAIGLAAIRRLEPRHPVLAHLLPEHVAHDEHSDGVTRLVQQIANINDDPVSQLNLLVDVLCGREAMSPSA